MQEVLVIGFGVQAMALLGIVVMIGWQSRYLARSLEKIEGIASATVLAPTAGDRIRFTLSPTARVIGMARKPALVHLPRTDRRSRWKHRRSFRRPSCLATST